MAFNFLFFFPLNFACFQVRNKLSLEMILKKEILGILCQEKEHLQELK